MPSPDFSLQGRALKVALVAGEASGDILGAGLIKEIKRHYPDATFYGIGGPLMQAEGFVSLFPMERLSVMGLTEVLGRLRELLGIRKQLRERLIADQPDVFIGIDAPDFNLALERKLKASGIPTVHYVSPQVWAWREGRLKKIKHAVDHILALLPFEVDYYRNHDVAVTFVGHPLADQIAMEPDQDEARQKLGLSNDGGPVIGLLPGSRKAEIAKLGQLFLDTARLLRKDFPDAQFLIPCANQRRKQQILPIVSEYPDLNVTVYDGQAQPVMAASDAILIASGTAVLEAALHKKPLVVSYKMAPLSYAIISRMVKVKYVALPNLLADKALVPEILQDDATPENLRDAMKKAVEDRDYRRSLQLSFTKVHQKLKQNASRLAFEAVMSVIQQANSYQCERGHQRAKS
ncbi:lipid-A-disaccharide synthase [Endozoicomonas elysicola]|uniref:Lipid-A-disaccharide synthase n=1 Tax=Endozoicomonas elysicola TaxID=305900 RepID=A0A081KD46_9GAMM|nr:lipid-A-disaccharide synthase [Endozoicomonas elysicola]KEI72072.1 lipid-A-disaccharide synthase [Endozoicomonas elysicola]